VNEFQPASTDDLLNSIVGKTVRGVEVNGEEEPNDPSVASEVWITFENGSRMLLSGRHIRGTGDAGIFTQVEDY
jgi:hypothetical protein